MGIWTDRYGPPVLSSPPLFILSLFSSLLCLTLVLFNYTRIDPAEWIRLCRTRGSLTDCSSRYTSLIAICRMCAKQTAALWGCVFDERKRNLLFENKYIAVSVLITTHSGDFCALVAINRDRLNSRHRWFITRDKRQGGSFFIPMNNN